MQVSFHIVVKIQWDIAHIYNIVQHRSHADVAQSLGRRLKITVSGSNRHTMLHQILLSSWNMTRQQTQQ